jgi:GT2 family glycosyltransferase
VEKLSKKEHDLSIIIVSYNTCFILVKCIESIYKYSENLKIQIIISDNASTDDTVETITKKFSSLTIIKNKKNLGFGRANNRAIPFCKGRFILFLNPDVILVEPVFRKMLNFIYETNDAGAVGCRLVNLDGSFQKSYYDTYPTLTNRFLDAMYIEKLIHQLRPLNIKRNAILKVAGITGACILVSRDLLDRLGGFDEQFFMYCEDIDFCYRMKQLGYNVYYLGNMKMIHSLGAITKNNKASYFTKVLTKDSVHKYFLKHSGRPKAIIYKVSMLVAAIFRLTVLLPLWLVSRVVQIKTNMDYHRSMLTYLKVVSWGLGFEKWTRNPGSS